MRGFKSLVLLQTFAAILASVALSVASITHVYSGEGNATIVSGPPDPKIYAIEPTPEQRQHWAYQQLSPVAIPETTDKTTAKSAGILNPIDAFILTKLHANDLEFSAPAEPQVWLRRVFFDLIGLPPSPHEVDMFLADPSDAAKQRVVERLLADPGYGVRWGRKWLDLARYADTNGYERDGDKPSAWRYRDYVFDSLNADKPFNQFLTEQIAGDEFDHPTAESMSATTFLRLGTWDDEPADPVVDRYDQLDDVVRAVSTTFLGITLNCARCHNHKFEPFSQVDYTRMLAVFAPLERPQEGRTEFDLPVGTPLEISVYSAVKKRSDTAIKQLETEIDSLQEVIRQRVLADMTNQLVPEVRTAFLTTASQRVDAQKKLIKENQKLLNKLIDSAHTPDERRQSNGFQKALLAIRESQPVELPRAYVFHERSGQVPPVQVFRRGDPTTPAGCVEPGVPDVMSASSHLPIEKPKNSATSGRRLALANWMTDTTRCGLVARVIVNRIWQGHFGEGLVRTENDFGVMGSLPTHPELLEWLADTFVNRGWKLKDLHRSIVLSQVYSQASTWREKPHQIDQSNEFLWRFPYRRLDAEPIRDAILLTNGTLNLKLGGPGIYPKIGADVLATQSRPGNGWGKSTPDEAGRRTAFIFVKRSLLVPFMELMDLPDTTSACEQRNISTIPTQSLTLMNSEFMNDQAKLFAERLRREAGTEINDQVHLAYRLALARAPDADELQQAVQFIQQRQGSADPDAAGQALPAFCLVMYNLNEFYYLD